MNRIALATRLTAITIASALTCAASFAEPMLTLVVNGKSESMPIQNATMNLSRSPQYDMETGAELTNLPSTLSTSSINVQRKPDAGTLPLVSAIVSDQAIDSATITFDDGRTWVLSMAKINNYSTYTLDESDAVESVDMTYKTLDLRSGNKSVRINATN